MATYIYYCTDCDMEFEQSRSMKEQVSTTTCPSCSRSECKQVFVPREGYFNSYFEDSYKGSNY